jgi:hypothetical protein
MEVSAPAERSRGVVGTRIDLTLVFLCVADKPIRISPSLLLFPKPSALKEIYRDPKCNQKSGLYGTGVLGPPHLFTTLNGNEHRDLRKALGGAPVSPGGLLLSEN